MIAGKRRREEKGQARYGREGEYTSFIATTLISTPTTTIYYYMMYDWVARYE